MKHASPLSSPNARDTRAVEVVTMLGDSVVDIAHIEPERPIRPRRVGYAFFVAAGLCLALAGFAFAKGVHTAAQNQDALVAWAQSGQPVHDFRPVTLSPVYDAMAFAGLGLGLVSVVLGVIAMRRRESRTEFSIGTASDADVSSAQAPSERFTLVAQRGGRAVVAIAPDMTVAMQVHGRTHEASELAALGLARRTQDGGLELPLQGTGTLSVGVGQLRFGIRQVTLEGSRIKALAAYFDERMAKFFGISAIAHMAVLALFYTMPPEAHSLALDMGTASDRQIVVRNPAFEPPIVEPDAIDTATQTPDGQGGATMAIDKPSTDSGGSPGSNDVRPNDHRPPQTRDQAITSAINSGPLVALRGNSPFAQLTDGSFLDPGDIDGRIYSMVAQDGYGPGGSTFGNHVWGPGNQPGGTIQSDGYRTDVTMTTCGPGPCANLGPRDRVARGPVVQIDRPNIVGDLDKSIIRRYIKRKVARIQHCYERELMSDPSLSGTVTTEFMINGQGKVMFAKAAGMGNERLESCVADVVATVVFPRPSDDGAVQVKYPFHFRKAG